MALRTKLEQAIAAQEIPDAADVEDAQESLKSAEEELAKPQPRGNRVLRKLDELSQIVTRSAETAESAGKPGIEDHPTGSSCRDCLADRPKTAGGLRWTIRKISLSLLKKAPG